MKILIEDSLSRSSLLMTAFKFMKFQTEIQVKFYVIFIGIWEGKFLERSKYKNIENEHKQFTISDFEINKSMRINTFSFHILDADEFTKKWMSDNMK